MLWDNRSQSQALANLRVVLSSLRHHLGQFVEITRTTAAVRPDAPLTLDASRLETALQQPITPGTVGDYDDALELYHGPFLEGFYLHEASRFETWQLHERERLHLMVLDGLQKRVDYARTHNDCEGGIGYANRLLTIEPLSEKAHRDLMELLARCGLRERALAQYETCRELLSEELGIRPEPATVVVYRRIQDGPPQGPAPPEARPHDKPQPLRLLSETAERRAAASSPFVAREEELDILHRRLEEAISAGPRVVFVAGESGTGKTALQEVFSRRAEDAHPDLLVALGQCTAFAGTGDPYLPFCDIIDTLAGGVGARWRAGAITSEQVRRLWQAFPLTLQALFSSGDQLFDLFVSASDLQRRIERASFSTTAWSEALQRTIEGSADRHGSGRQQMFSQITELLRELAAHHPLLLILEDLHWADTASLSLLFHLARRLESSPILFLGTYRPEELVQERGGERHPLLRLLNEFTHLFGNITMTLGAEEDRGFIDAFLDTEPNRLGARFRKRLFERTGGHPLYTVELLRALQARGDVYRDEGGQWVEASDLDWQTLPARVRGVIAERIERLDPQLRATLSLASVEGLTFTGPLLTELLDVPERELLSRLCRELDQKHRLVREASAVKVDERRLWRYRFAHPMFQEYLYDRLAEGERRLLHASVAQILEQLFANQPDAVAVPLAHHYLRAGTTDKAIKYNTRAGDLARRLYAHEDAAAFYLRALRLLKEQGKVNLAAHTLMKLGLTYHSAFDYERARQSYEEGFALWQRAAKRFDRSPPAVTETLKLDYPGVVKGFDPMKVGGSRHILLLDQLFSGLVATDPDLNIIPNVARSWKIAQDGRHYRFFLRDDFYWSDGRQVTASDFVYAWTRLLDPDNKVHGAFLLHDIVGATAFNRGQSTNAAELGVKALDDCTLDVQLERPTSQFLHVMAQPEARPVPRHVLQAHGELGTDEETTITNGPFRLACWRHGESLVLERDPRHPGSTAGNVKRIQITVEPNSERRLERFVAGASDLVDLNRIAPAQGARVQLLSDNNLSIRSLLTWYLAFNVNVPPLDDPRVRRALAMAIDRRRVADTTLPGNVLPADGGVIPPGMTGHSAGVGLPYDPQVARCLLAEAGYPGGRGLPTIRYGTFHTVPGNEDVRNQWHDQLAVTVEPHLLRSFAMAGHEFNAGRVDILNIGWICDCPDPDDVLRIGMRDYGSWHKQYASLVERARHLADQKRRLELYHRAERLLIDEVVVFPLLYGRTNLLVKPWVIRLPVSALKWWFLQDVVIERT